ncbi:MAG: hypothetical protein E7345_01565 [Clostridiales bacterium]|nr:hypothetical protein [Clostridiales bacterium]
MNIDEIYKKSQEKGKDIESRYSEKISIVENNSQLSEEEKQQVYSKLLKRVEKEKNRLARFNEIGDFVFSAASEIGDDQMKNLALGGVGLASVLVGCLGLATSTTLISGPSVASILSSVAMGLGAVSTGVSVLNFEKDGGSIMNKLATKQMYDHIYKKEALDEVEKRLNVLVNENNADMEL